MSFLLSDLSGMMQHDSMVPMVALRVGIGMIAIIIALYGSKPERLMAVKMTN